MRKILVIGATSAIAEATARLFAIRGDSLFLVARDSARLSAIAQDLKVRGAHATATAMLDVRDLENHQYIIEQAWTALGKVDVVLIAHGTLPVQADCEASVSTALVEFNTNAVSTIALLTLLAQRMEAQSSGTLAVISSVAGDRGRASNYLYGSAKAAVSTFTSGLRQRLSSHGIHVLTIKPGFVDTPMTREFSKGALWAQPAQIARGIVDAIDRRRSVVYLPWFWGPIMLVIRCVPEFVFKRVKL